MEREINMHQEDFIIRYATETSTEQSPTDAVSQVIPQNCPVNMITIAIALYETMSA